MGIFAICIVELVILTARRKIHENQEVASVYGGYVVSYLLAVAYQLKGQTILEPDNMNYMLVVATFVPLGYVLGRYLPPFSNRSLAGTSVALSVACAFALLKSGAIYASLNLKLVLPLVLVGLSLGSVYVSLIVLNGMRMKIGVVLLPALIAATIQSLPDYAYDACRAIERLNVFIVEASTYATKIAGRPQRTYVLADPDELLTRPCFEDYKVFKLAVSLTEIGHNFIGDQFKPKPIEQLTSTDFAGLVQDSHGLVALLVSQDHTEERFLQTATNLGINLDLAGLFPHRTSGARLVLYRPQVPARPPGQ